jgi:CRP-like cAMP-binding protein
VLLVKAAMTGNLLLDSLPEADLQKIQEKSKPVVLTVRQVLSTQGEFVEHVYFPTTGLVSCRASGSQGELLEIYAVGHDGIVEPAAILTSVAAVTSEVQIAGQAYRIRIDDLCILLNQTKELTRVLLKYAYSLAVRMVQATKCAMFHSVKQRLVLWLLQANIAQGKVIPCTHQAIADALGTRRASVTLVLNELANSGILKMDRGRITITNRSGLEQASCDCFELIKAGREPELECEIGA